MTTDEVGTDGSGARRAAFEEFSRSEIEQAIPTRFEAAARRFEAHTAVESGTATLRYGDLDRQANRVAHRIVESHGSGDGRVALIFKSIPALMPALLGVLKAGKIYVPVDPSYPANRVRFILDDSDACLVLTDSETESLTRELVPDSCPILSVNDVPDDAPDKGLRLATSPDDIATLLYTSGSTGVPKGVMQTHRNVLQHVRNYTNNLGIASDDRISLLFSYSFSASLLDIFGALLNGAALCPFDVRSHDAATLARWVGEARITHLHLVPSLYRRFTGALTGQEVLDALRRVDMAGEPIHDSDVATHRRLLPTHCDLVYRFAASEASFITHTTISAKTPVAAGAVPVGRPGDGMEVLIEDGEGNAVPNGTVGEIVLRSAYLCPGFWQRPDLTEKVFSQEPGDEAIRRYRTGDLGRLRPDGVLEHLGRGDTRVKIRGFTVDLSEVEAALRGVEGVRDAVVVAREDGRESAELAAFLVPEDGVSLARAAVRVAMLENVPSYMVPSVIVPTPALPLTPTGKVDQRALVELAADEADRRGPPIPPRDELETALAQIWCEALKLESIGVLDDFFALGGDSMAAVEIVTRVEDELDHAVPTSILHVAPTIEELAARLRTMESVHSESLALPFRVHGDAPPLFAVPGRGGDPIVFSYLAKNLAADRPFYGMATPGLAHEEAIPRSFEELAAAQLEAIREIQPNGPYYLVGFSSGALVAYELCRQIQALGETVAFLGVLDGWAPGYPRLAEGRRWFQRLADLGPGRSVIVLRQTSARILFRQVLTDIRREIGCRFDEAVGRTLSRPQRYQRIKRRHTGHRSRYRPRQLPLRLALFRAEVSNVPDHYAGEPLYGWGEFASEGVDVFEFPGRHNDMVYEPVVCDVAKQLDACMAQAAQALEANEPSDRPGR